MNQCPNCEGTGRTLFEYPLTGNEVVCTKCGGTGAVEPPPTPPYEVLETRVIKLEHRVQGLEQTLVDLGIGNG